MNFPPLATIEFSTSAHAHCALARASTLLANAKHTRSMSLPTEMQAIANTSCGENLSYGITTLPVPAVEGESDLCSLSEPLQRGALRRIDLTFRARVSDAA